MRGRMIGAAVMVAAIVTAHGATQSSSNPEDPALGPATEIQWPVPESATTVSGLVRFGKLKDKSLIVVTVYGESLQPREQQFLDQILTKAIGSKSEFSATLEQPPIASQAVRAAVAGQIPTPAGFLDSLGERGE